VDLRRLAVMGAQARLSELRAEEAALRGAFPELSRAHKAASAANEAVAAPVRRRRKRSRMSAEARKAVSERMLRYWAGRRKAKQKGK
jgi:hypothetical protein